METFFTQTKPFAANPIEANQRAVSIIPVAYLLLAFALLQIAVTFLTFQRTLSFDEAMWQYIGRNWFRNGLQPYSGGIDNKSPLIFALFGFSDKLFGVNYWFPRVIGIFFQSAGIFFVCKIAEYYAGRKAGLFATLVYGLSLLWHATGGKYVSYTETFSIALSIAAFYFAIAAQKNTNIFLSAILCGIAVAFRFTGCLSALAIIIHLIGKKRNAFIFLLGMMVPITILIVAFYFCGIQPYDLYTNMLADNFTVGAVTDHSLHWRVNSLAGHFLKSQLLLFLPVLIFSFLSRRINKSIVTWLACEFIGISIIGLYSNQHFKNLLPQLSLLTAFILTLLTTRYKISTASTVIITVLLFFPETTEPILVLKDIFLNHENVKTNAEQNTNTQPDENGKKEFGLWIRSNTTSNDKVLIAGYGAISQAYSERISPTIYFNVTQTPTAKQRLFEELDHNKPFMIAIPNFPEYSVYVSADIRKFIAQLAATEYYQVQNLYGYKVYERKHISVQNISLSK
ncbi:MAG: glycosyltransferase family 39 protein [Bacteroidetes bacterium]|nr:glycosyltransferase family 39 protein [Bacteroidota bacterium]